MLNARLSARLEATARRASGQAGFRPDHQTIDNCFIPRALAERARARGVKLYICAVDLEKAFDSMSRSHCWAALGREGVGGRMLRAIQSMYADVPVCVKSDSGLSACFQYVIGVKQGCPLSPLLFGVLLDDLQEHMGASLGAAACWPLLAGRPVPPCSLLTICCCCPTPRLAFRSSWSTYSPPAALSASHPCKKKRKKNGHALHSCQEGCRQPGAAAWLPTSTGVTAALVTWLQGGGFGASEAHCAHGRTRSVKERCRKMEAEWM